MVKRLGIAVVSLLLILAFVPSALADGPNWTYEWWTDGSGEVVIYRKGEKDPRLGAIVFYADLSTPYGIRSTFEGVSPTEGYFNGSQKLGCETAVYADRYSGYASLRQGSCGWPQTNPHLRPQAERGVPVPVSSDPSLPGGSIWEPVGVDTEGRNVDYQVFADAKTLELIVQVLKSNPEGQPGVGSTIEVRIPKGQALELLVNVDVGGYVGATYLTFWNDQTGWKFVLHPARLAEGEPLWSLWSLNKLRIESDGQAWYTELPFSRRPAAA